MNETAYIEQVWWKVDTNCPSMSSEWSREILWHHRHLVRRKWIKAEEQKKPERKSGWERGCGGGTGTRPSEGGQVAILTTILKRKRLLPAKSLSSTLSNVPPMSGNTTHSQVPGNVGSAPSNLQGFACVKNDELKMHLAVLEAVCLGVLKVHIK